MKANTERLYKDVEFLTEINPSRNYLNLDSINKVVEYIKEEFQQMGVSSIEQKWMARKNEYSNIIASYEPLKSKRLIVFGPAPAPITRIRNRYRYKFLLKTDKNVNIQEFIKQWLSKVKKPNTTRILIDVDPYNFL